MIQIQRGLHWLTTVNSAAIKRAALLVILLTAALLRFSVLPDFPPGIEHDEVAEVLIAEGILRGQHALFFHEAYGQEPLFLYLVAGALVLFGRNMLALRFVTATIGLLTVAAATRLARRLFDAPVALITAAGLAVMLWPVFWSRVGLRAMLLPLLMCLAADALWRALYSRNRSRRYAWLSGWWWGLAMYTYLAARGIPILLVSFLIYLAIVERDVLRSRWREIGIVGVSFVLIAAPLCVYLRQNPDLQTRVYEVQAPLTALRQGDMRPVLENAARVLGMFGIRGDPIERNNYPGRPVFVEPVWVGLFCVGGCVALLQLRDARYAFTLLWLGVMLSPTLVTTDAPNFVRSLGALPAVMLLPGIGAAWLMSRAQRRVTRLALIAALLLAFCWNVGLTTQDYFWRWAQIPEVGFVWQHDLLAVAAWLDAHLDVYNVAVGGLSNATMDAPSLDLLLHRNDLNARWADPGSPLGSGGAFVMSPEGGYFLVPSVVPLRRAVEEYLMFAERALVKRHPRFTEFGLAPRDLPAQNRIPFAGNISLLNFALSKEIWQPGEIFFAFSTWVVEEGQHPPLKAFLHLMDAAETLRAQHDGLDSVAQYWQPGDYVVQSHWISLPPDLPAGAYTLRLGMYDRETLAPYPPLDGRAYIEVGTIYVQQP